MLLHRKDAESNENAIERRSGETKVSGWLRRAARSHKSNAGQAGLFLVKPAKMEIPMERSNRLESLSAPHVAPFRAKPAWLKQPRSGSGKVIPMPDREKLARQERLLGLMAALGPLLWIGHAALRWLKVV